MGQSKSLHDHYEYGVIRGLVVSTLFFGALGLSAGLWAALELTWPILNFDLPGLSFGRLRPVHTTLVIFGMGGSALIGTSFYVVQRTCQVRLAFPTLAYIVWIGWTIVFTLVPISYMMGYTQGKEYAEFEWIFDWAIAVIWLIYFFVFVMTVLRRKQKHIYVANWFYLAFILATTLLHVFNNISIPVFSAEGLKSYNVFSGMQDAMVQWWYGHNAVGFILTVAFLGMMYYFIPKEAGRPIYSYRLSIVHFWALTFLYMWAGAHHLHWTSLPDWVSSLSATFSIILLLPSWGGMINGIMTLSGAWDSIRTNPIIRFMVVSLSFYGMSTFEGPLMSLRSVNALSHYTDWTVGHVHAGALGWVAMITFASLYHMVPRIFGGKIWSEKMIFAHFWLATIGIVIYIVSLWVAGIGQGMMLRAFNPEYGTLAYEFIETVKFMHTPYIFRAIGGGMFLLGAVLMIINFVMTMIVGTRAQADNNALIPDAKAHA